jgi:lysophospholipid acyltransferase (LPLAT)-like uncharacterized protein
MSSALDLRTRIAIRLGHLAFKVLGATWRLDVHGWQQYVARHARGEHTVLAFWHGQMLMALRAHRRPIAVMISEHRDGEIIAQVLRLAGHSTVRGSSSRGGARALLEAARVIANGSDVAITPDGPRGPRHSYAQGAVALAYRASVPVVSLAASASRAWRLKSWDGFEIPKPFARITVVYSDPQWVDATDARSAAEQAERFGAMLHETYARAEQLGRRGYVSEARA